MLLMIGNCKYIEAYFHVRNLMRVGELQIDRMKLQGCRDEGKILLAYQTYLELRESKRLFIVIRRYYSSNNSLISMCLTADCLKNLFCDYDADLDITYVTENVADSSNIYVPVHSTFSLTPSWIYSLQSKLSKTEPKR